MSTVRERWHAAVTAFRIGLPPKPVKASNPKLAICSFCDKNQKQVLQIIVRFQVAICDECVMECANVILDTARKHRVTQSPIPDASGAA